MNKFILVALLLLSGCAARINRATPQAAASAPTPAATPVASAVQIGSATPQTGSMEFGGLTRTFLVYIPNKLPDEPVPLVMMLHGGGGSGRNAMDDTTEYRWNELASSEDFIVVYPDGIDHFWNDCRSDNSAHFSAADDIGFLKALVGTVDAMHPIDRQRVYAAGHSNGAMMALRLGLEAADTFAAVAANSGLLAADTTCQPSNLPVGVLLLAGTADPSVPYTGGAITPLGGGDNGTVLSVADTLDFWTRYLDINGAPSASALPDLVSSDGSSVTQFEYPTGSSGANLRYFEIDNGGHGWPAPTQFGALRKRNNGLKNQDIVAADRAWEFFSAQHQLN